ncbi:hypothetical protein PIB30_097034 [Stylosanthes scabra]|uniref:Uncharacterized protein n=1 Tax=Stylosanthes scabra TaxID=79078 RepID=A0ABU6WW37_9FABA|nr:hypothetical protein [Stylosanthes scabra]
MSKIVKDLQTTRHPLAFPNVIDRLCKGEKVDYRAPNSMEAVPKIRPITAAVKENIRYPHYQPPPPPPQPQQYFGEGSRLDAKCELPNVRRPWESWLSHLELGLHQAQTVTLWFCPSYLALFHFFLLCNFMAWALNTLGVLEARWATPRRWCPPPPQPQQYFGEGEHQEQPAYDAQMSQGYGWGQLQADMANLRTTQTEFYENILAQNNSYGLLLQEMEGKQNDMCAEQNQFYKDERAYQEQQREYQKLQQEQFQQLQAEQAQFHQEFTTHVNDFSTRMDKVHTELEAEKERTSKLEGLVVGLSLDTRANDTYTHWGLQQCVPNLGLQQCVPNLVPTNPSSIPHRIRDNYKAGKPLLEGLTRPTPPGESSGAAQKSKSTPKKK